MKIAGVYSFNDGEKVVNEKYPDLLKEIFQVISNVDAEACFTKISKEKTSTGETLYNPTELNELFRQEFAKYNWKKVRERCNYPSEFYVNGFKYSKKIRRPYREMDFVKNKLGIEVQFGKYSFMVYNVAAKMTIFKNKGHIDTGIEIVPVKGLADKMSTGVSYFEQFVWDLQARGISNIDIPVLILGITTDMGE